MRLSLNVAEGAMITNELNWRDQLTSAIKTHEELEEFFAHKFPRTHYPIFIPRSWALRIKEFGIDSPLGKQFLPHESLGPKVFYLLRFRVTHLALQSFLHATA